MKITLALLCLFLPLLAAPAEAAQSLTFTLTKPAGYFDGTPFGTEQLVYVVYNVAGDVQLFSTLNLVTTRVDVPDGALCFYVRAGVYDVTNNKVVANTLGDPSPNSCPVVTPPPPTAKKVGIAGLAVTRVAP